MKYWGITIIFSIGIIACKKNRQMDNSMPKHELAAEVGEEYSGGASTVFDVSPNAFGLKSPVLNGLDESNFFVGNSFFNQIWVVAPASTTARDGLGPVFNANNCNSCHFKDGRGRPFENSLESSKGILFRLSIAGVNIHGGPIPEPNYGEQLNDLAIAGVPLEGKVQISHTIINGAYADDKTYELRQPNYQFTNLAFGPLAANVMVSPRIGQQMCGLGLLEAIDENDILKNIDETDSNNDGISGKANYVWDFAANGTVLGRFGWKANQPNLRQQVASAFIGDLGITSSLFTIENCTAVQNDCSIASNGGTPEITNSNLDFVTLYTRSLAVPARRNHADQIVLKGKKTFFDIGCATCHQQTFTTASNYPIEGLRNQKIFPYTDLLLHDMGTALADNRPDYLANGNEWRTPPLWGIGLIPTVNNHSYYLHDGRARNLIEAVLWHGGEAESSQQKFKQLSATERSALLTFLESL